MIKAVALISGGIDSILACKLILKQGIEVEGINFITLFSDNNSSIISSLENSLGIKINIFEVSKDFLDIVKHPKYGYGSGVNPCLDCRIFMLKKAKKFMQEIGASFLITGEVLGERPFSQRKDCFKIVEREVGLEGLILRPLSAKFLEPTLVERKGWVNREELFSIKGRSRKPQLKLAELIGIKDFLQPAGGCLLTDPCFSKRMRDLMKYKPEFSLNDIELLKLGRHFRFSPEAKLIVGRNKLENDKLLELAQKRDFIFKPEQVKGPIALGREDFDKDIIFLASQIVAYYCDKKEGPILISIQIFLEGKEELISVFPASKDTIDKLRI
ncbi:MAG: tRNA 4-thiouridine(8) synthase ThiI [Candidatus Omnitrophica bacterium]|nr:tRNA 4-thiouridine(8) synthase ThiI [Candidatus Omnitrophota bacterium]MCM8799431.1 tRNA 4-thiouridine(8) synthase ThiI [Candidatus Omnitrophota bacterium]